MENQQIEEKKFLIDRQVLKWILNLWTVITIALFLLDFFSGNKYDSSASAIGAIYLAILGIYVGQKEFIRWKTRFVSNFIGESFIGIWTAIMLIFIIAAPLSKGAFKVPTEFAVIYTSIIGVFAITSYSKSLYQYEKKEKIAPKPEDLPKAE